MNDVVAEIVENAKHVMDMQEMIPITKTNPFLYQVLHLCLTNRDLMKEIPPVDCSYLGFAYMHILSLTDEPSVFQVYSTIGFYFNEKALSYKKLSENIGLYIQTLNDAIILMNIGARSLCRTFAQAYGTVPSKCVDFDNIETLPVYVRQILLCEYGYFKELETVLNICGASLDGDAQMLQRYEFLKWLVSNGYFDEFGVQEHLFWIAKEIRRKVYVYAASKIDKGDIVFQ